MSDTKELNMDYNSDRNLLIIPEYGRHLQNLVEHAKTIEDDEERQIFAERLIKLMMQISPQSRTVEDYEEKLWKHLFRIAQYDFNVKPTKGEIPTEEEARIRPDQVPYSVSKAKFRHYGENVQMLIDKALAMEPGVVQDGFIAVIGSYMKLAFKTWNRDLYVSDEVIKKDLLSLSDGKLVIPDNVSIDSLSQGMNRKHGNKRGAAGGRTGGRQGGRNNRSGGRNNNGGGGYKSKGRNDNRRRR